MILEKYTELLALTRLHLTQHYEAKAAKMVDLDTYTFFRRCAQQQKEQKTQSPKPSVLPPAAPHPQASLPTTQTRHGSTPPIRPPLPAFKTVSVDEERKTIPPHLIEPTPEKKIGTQEKTAVENKGKKSKSLFELEPLQPAATVDFGDIQNIIIERFPAQKILHDIPSDASAKIHPQDHVIAHAEVLILSFSDDPQQMEFLLKLANAISVRLKSHAEVISARDLEHESQWNIPLKSKALRLVIASGHLIHAYPKLMQHYREEPKKARFYVGKVPLCLYSDISLYLQEPTLKLSLWKSVCELLD